MTKLEKTKVAPDRSVPHITAECVVNAASYIGGAVAPGEIVSVYGAGIGPADLIRMPTREDGKIQTTLAETRILFNGVPAPLVFVSATQSSAIVPYSIAPLPAVDVQVEYKGVRSMPVPMPVVPARLGVFTLDGSGRGQAMGLNEDGSLNTTDNPAKQGSVIVLFVTGEGLTDPAGVEDHVIGDILSTPKLSIMAFTTWAGDCDFAKVVSASSVRGSIPGLLEVKLRLSEQPVCVVGDHLEAIRGTVPMYFRNGQQFYSSSQPGVTLAIN